MTIASTIKDYVIGEYLPDTPPDELEPSYDLLENGVVDSLRLLQLIAWVGERFDIPVDDIDLSPDNFRSIDAIHDLVENVRKAGVEGELRK
jgi:acyl carrier protein